VAIFVQKNEQTDAGVHMQETFEVDENQRVKKQQIGKAKEQRIVEQKWE